MLALRLLEQLEYPEDDEMEDEDEDLTEDELALQEFRQDLILKSRMYIELLKDEKSGQVHFRSCGVGTVCTRTTSCRPKEILSTSMVDKQYVFSCGGGVQSTACLVLAAQGHIPYKKFIFSNVGNKAESPATIKYINTVLKPYAERNGVEWIEVAWVDRKGRQSGFV